jgi:hypothetical protein
VVCQAAALDAVIVDHIAESQFVHTPYPGLCSITGNVKITRLDW